MISRSIPTPRSGRRGADGNVTCWACRGSGIDMQSYLIKWKSGTLTHKGDKRDPILSSLIRQLGDEANAPKIPRRSLPIDLELTD